MTLAVEIVSTTTPGGGSFSDDRDGAAPVVLQLCRVVEGETSSTGSGAADDEEEEATAVRLVDLSARLLEEQWPRGAPYREKLVQKGSGRRALRHDEDGEEGVDNKSCTYWLPCSYLLVGHPPPGRDDEEGRRDGFLAGHGRLTECFEGSCGGGNAAAATFVMIDPKSRGRGLGRVLMGLLEDEAVRLGYHYLYLWTHTAVPFYEKLGYAATERVGLHRACLKSLAQDQVSLLERMLSLHRQARDGSGENNAKKNAPSETILLPPSDDGDAQENDVWLRKRLVDFVGSVDISLSQRIKEISAAVSNYGKEREYQPPLAWEYQLIPVPWQAQIGPSCGLTALRMLRDHYHAEPTRQKLMPSLLAAARENGYSSEGEVFDIDNLRRLAESVCGLRIESRLFTDTSARDISDIIKRGGTVVFAYDSKAGTRQPCQVGGRQAHYGIVVGLLFGFPEDEPIVRDLVPYGDRAVEQAECVCLLVQQSLGSKLVIAEWDKWVKSNQQLVSMDREKYRAERINLRNRLLVVRGTNDCT